MDEVHVKAIAAAVVEQLGGPVVSSSLPFYIGKAIGDATEHGAVWWTQNIPLRGPYSISVRWMLHPDGTVIQELTDWNGQSFWRGTFRPVEEVTSG